MVEQNGAQAEVIETECAFLMYLDQDGHWIARPDMNVDIRHRRQPSVYDFAHAASTLLRDVQTAETAGRVLLLMQQQSEAIVQEMERRKATEGGGSPGGGSPGVPNVPGSSVPDLGALRRQ